MVSASAYAADPASTGTASRPTPTIPIVNKRNANSPERFERARRLRGGLDVRDTGGVQGDGGGQNDEDRHQIRIEHAAPGVPTDAAQLRGGRRGIVHEPGFTQRLQVLDF